VVPKVEAEIKRQSLNTERPLNIQNAELVLPANMSHSQVVSSSDD
jgi:hypothetical protein